MPIRPGWRDGYSITFPGCSCCEDETCEPVFPAEPCDMPPVEPVPAVHMLTDTTVPEAPDAINECPIEDIPLPDALPPCPVLGSEDEGATSVVGWDEKSVTIRVIPLPNCEFDLEVDVDFPCSELGPGDLIATSEFVPTGDEGLAITITKVGDCDWDFDADIDFPCANLGPGTVPATSSFVEPGNESLTLTITKIEPCDWDFDMDVEFPCPNLAGVYPGTVSASATPGITLTITQNGATCDGWDFDIDLQMPTGGLDFCTTIEPLWEEDPAENEEDIEFEEPDEDQTEPEGQIGLRIIKTPGLCEYRLEPYAKIKLPRSAVFRVKNMSEAPIPARGLIRVFGVSSDVDGNIVLAGFSPNVYGSQYTCYVNTDGSISVGAVGNCVLLGPVRALYETGDGTPAPGEHWGPRSGTVKLKKNTGGFVILGDPSGGEVLVQQRPMLKIKGTVDNDVALNGTVIVSIFTGEGEGTDTGVNMAGVKNTFGDLVSGSYVWCQWDDGVNNNGNGGWVITSARCEQPV